MCFSYPESTYTAENIMHKCRQYIWLCVCVCGGGGGDGGLRSDKNWVGLNTLHVL